MFAGIGGGSTGCRSGRSSVGDGKALVEGRGGGSTSCRSGRSSTGTGGGSTGSGTGGGSTSCRSGRSSVGDGKALVEGRHRLSLRMFVQWHGVLGWSRHVALISQTAQRIIHYRRCA